MNRTTNALRLVPPPAIDPNDDIAIAATCLRRALNHRVSDRANLRAMRSPFRPLLDSIRQTFGKREPGRPEEESIAAARQVWAFDWVERTRNQASVETARIEAAIKAAWPIVAVQKDEPDLEPAEVQHATLADAIEVVGEIRYLWDQWIPMASMTLISARGGCGKTRFGIDIAKRLWTGEDMPDGTPNRMPKHTRTLMHLADRNWAETHNVAKNFGLPSDSVLLTSFAHDPLRTPDFDDPATIEALEAQIEMDRPGLVIIDTITYSTSKDTTRASETKNAFDGLLDVAGRTGIAVLAITHLNNAGTTLNRRIEERARSVLSMTKPDPDGQPNRRRLEVIKSACEAPSAMGVTMKTDGCDYDDNPPEAPADPDAAPRPRGPKATKGPAAAEWLKGQLAGGEWTPVARIGDLAREDKIISGPSMSSIYAARNLIAEKYAGFVVEESEAESGGGGRPGKLWRLVNTFDADTGGP